MSTATVPYVNGHSTLPISMVAVEPESQPVKLATKLKEVGTRRDYQMIDPREIDIEPGFNARDYSLPENRAHLDRLKLLISQSIEEGGPGVEKPIIVRLNKQTGRATVVDGECRLRAVLELIAEGHEVLSLADMPCYPAPDGSNNLVTRTFASLNANEGKPLSKWELGKKYQELYNANVSTAKIAARTGNTETFVCEAMELATAPDELKQLLSDAAVTPAEAKRVIRTLDADPDAVKKLQEAVQAKRDKGETGPVKRPKAQSKPAQSTAPAASASTESKPKPESDGYKVAQFIKGMKDLLADFPITDLYIRENEWISVSREKLLALSNTVLKLTPPAETEA